VQAGGDGCVEVEDEEGEEEAKSQIREVLRHGVQAGFNSSHFLRRILGLGCE
jgi:hypothetical protein